LKSNIAVFLDLNEGRVTANPANGMLGKFLVFRASATKNAADGYPGTLNFKDWVLHTRKK
jgi:hypothetical protein